VASGLPPNSIVASGLPPNELHLSQAALHFHMQPARWPRQRHAPPCHKAVATSYHCTCGNRSVRGQPCDATAPGVHAVPCHAVALPHDATTVPHLPSLHARCRPRTGQDTGCRWKCNSPALSFLHRQLYVELLRCGSRPGVEVLAPSGCTIAADGVPAGTLTDNAV
jgi:hypothetical protein